jgi:Protein of unknown function (DUF1573)
MRFWMLIIAAILLGLGFGLGITIVELGPTPAGNVAEVMAAKTGVASEHGPRVALDAEEFDFGTMERGSHKSHTFVVRNDGHAPLLLKKGDTTCRCTKFDIVKTELAPGESTAVELEWQATVPPGQFRQSATIDTNDPAVPQLKLSIVGKVTSSFRVDPETITFSGISVTESHTAKVRIFSYRPGKLEVLSTQLDDTPNADKFEVHVEPMPEETVKAEENAQSGVLLVVTAKPGLPLGAFRQKIDLKLNVSEDVVSVPIEGTTESNLQVAGKGWDRNRGILIFDNVVSSVGAKANLILLARSPDRTKLHPSIKEVTPDILKVTFGQPIEATGEGSVRVPFTVEIPPGTKPVAHLGGAGGNLGEILIDTGDPETPTVKLRVQFAVQD